MRDVRELFALTRIVDFFDWRYRLARYGCLNKGRYGRYKDDDNFLAM
jgi:hypothetical protein